MHLAGFLYRLTNKDKPPGHGRLNRRACRTGRDDRPISKVPAFNQTPIIPLRLRSCHSTSRDHSSFTWLPSVKSDKSSNQTNSTKRPPRGYLPVCVGHAEFAKRYYVKAKHLNHPVFIDLLERTANECGYSHSGVLRLLCDVELFEEVLAMS
ncbi:hypothetical protein KP509_11G079900 [Ceratopteris richardii]|uniref:Uncharacterized protein n=1 Tax=Ceratopteris richardii TaxID=49495 RepID=A0A8T2TR09_CERRI|nr:hypothetical protein KP509_11G079900 [Ceratopteris richardii]